MTETVRAAYAKTWYLKNRNRQLALAKKYRLENLEEVKRKKKEKREQDGDRIREQERKYDAKRRAAGKIKKYPRKRRTPEQHARELEQARMRRAVNPIKDREKGQRHRAKNPFFTRACTHINNLKRKHPSVFTNDGSENPELLELWLIESQAPCKYCGDPEPTHIDHIQPVTRDGLHEWSNLQLICKRCNVSKNDRNEVEFVEWIGRLAERLRTGKPGI